MTTLSIFALLDALEQVDTTPAPSPATIEKQTFSEVVASWGYKWEGEF